MPRPIMDRCVAGFPTVELFKPSGVPVYELIESILSIDEYEALRLADYEGLYQEAAAQRMGISRQTFGRIIESARHKVADALVNGKALRFSGGKAKVGTHKETTTMIAVPTKGSWVDPHFGHCDQFTLFTVEESVVKSRETISASGQRGCKNGIAAILARKGVKVLLAENIGEGALRVFSARGISIVRGVHGPIQKAVEDYLSDALEPTHTKGCNKRPKDCSPL